MPRTPPSQARPPLGNEVAWHKDADNLLAICSGDPRSIQAPQFRVSGTFFRPPPNVDNGIQDVKHQVVNHR